jgi:glucose/arabinose dehydrogenase
MLIDWNIDSKALIALLLYAVYLAVALTGVILVWRGQQGRRWSGFLFILAGLAAAALLTLMSSKYWIAHHQVIAVPLRPLAVTVGGTLLPVALGLALAFGLARWFLRRTQSPQWILALSGTLLAMTGIGVLGTQVLIRQTLASQPRLYTPDSPLNQLVLHKDFSLSVFSHGGFQLPTSLRFGPDGRLYVADYNGNIWAIPVKDRAAGQPEIYATGFDKPVGLAWRGNDLYVASSGRISVIRNGADPAHAGKTDVLVSDLPTHHYIWHSNEGLAFGPDGRLYFPVGSTTDAAAETYRYAASILSVNPDGSDLQVFARGVRNPYSLAFNSANDLFATDNGPDNFTNTPGDELNHIVQGGDYGFPRYFEQPPEDSGTIGPVALFPPHASADGIAFYNGSQFPSEYKDNAFVALFQWGQIYRVQLVKNANGDYLAATSVFAQGFHDPLDLTVGPDGCLYLASWGDSAIFRICYSK